MSHYILIHGAWEQARIWGDVTPLLEADGDTVTAIDLPGHGEKRQPILQVTMASYVRAVVDAISALDHNVILVAHSMAGAITSQVAERIPDRIERLIYVAAFLLNDGESVLEAMQSDSAGEFLPTIAFSDDQSFATVPEVALRNVGFHDVDEHVIQRVLPLMAERQATEPFMANVVLSEENFGAVPKAYIRTALDKVTSPSLQDRMISNWHVESVLDLQSGHFPAFSAPDELAALLLQTAPALFDSL